MALNKLAHLVLTNQSSPNLLYKVLDNMTGGGHSSVRKKINSINKNLLLLDGKTLVPERVGFLLCLSKTTHTSGHTSFRAFKVLSCIGVICELPSSNCSNCCVNTTRFGDFVAHLVVVVRTRLACFGAGPALVRDLGYVATTLTQCGVLRMHNW